MQKLLKNTMSKELISVKYTDSLESAYLRLKRNKIRHLPVTDEHGNVIGIISDRDFQRGMSTDVRDYTSFRLVESDFDPRFQVKDFMTWPVKTVSEFAELSLVADRMVAEKISAFLVASDDDKIIGIITHEDLLKVLVELLRPPQSRLKSTIDKLSYRTPVGEIASFLGSVGI